MSTDTAPAVETKPEKAPAKKAAPRRGNTHVRRGDNGLLHHASPFLICGAAWPTAEIAHLAWGGNGAMAAGMGAGALGLTWFTHQTWHKRHERTQALATVFAGAVTGWTVLAAETSPLSTGMVDAWSLGSVLLSAAWIVRGHGLATPHEADKRTRPDDGLGLLARTVRSLRGAKAVSVEKSADGQRVSARVRLEKGTTAGQVQADKDAVASVLSVGGDQVSVSRVPGREDMVDVSVTQPSPLGSTVRWTPTPDSELGLSVADAPIVFGMRTDGRPLEMWMCGQDTTDEGGESRVLGHVLCTGVTGSGKTETTRTLIVLGRDRCDFVPVVADPEKFGQSFGDIEDALGLAAKNEKTARRLVSNLPAAVRYRAELMGRLKRADGGTGYKQWEPECWTLHGIPLVFVDIEEAASVLEGDNEDFDKGIRTARSVGIKIEASLQTAIHSNIERKTRGQFAESLVHGCMEDQDAKFSLSPATREAGADPTKWGGNASGSLYAEMVGTPSSEWAVDARTFWISPKEKRAALDRSKAAGHWAVLDPGTYAALADGVVEDVAPATIVGATRGAGKTSADYAEFWEPEDSVYTNGDEEETDVSVPIPPSRHTVPFQLTTAPEQKMSTENAQALFEARVHELEASGKDEVRFSDLADLAALTGRKRSWVYAQLQRLEKEGRLEATAGDGVAYTIRPRPRVPAINGHAHY